MNNKNQIGRNSLLISIVGLIVVQLAIYFGYLKSEYWHILLSGFEAATIGGFADWFAVSALFYEIPIPIIKKHTNIIVRSRAKLSEGIVDLVTNKWLSPEIITEKIADVPITENVIKVLKEPQNNVLVSRFLKEIVTRLTANIDGPEVVQMLQAILKEQLKDVNLSVPLGNWLKKSIKNGDHNQLWDTILNAAKKTIRDEATRKTLVTLVEKQIKAYKDEDFIKKLFIGTAGKIGVIDTDLIVDKIINAISEFVTEAEGVANHPFREKFDKSILEFSEGLIHNDPDAIKVIQDLQEGLVNNAETEPIITKILANFKRTIENQLKEGNSPLIDFLKENIDKLLDELETDKTAQNKIDKWVKKTISELVGKYHHEIGEMVRFSLSKLNDVELVGQIEEKVGNDLQFIRLNGALVGGFVGVLIATIRIILL
jgi:uncharacterized membrane-anchored protein YjiN (DUF445 family)